MTHISYSFLIEIFLVTFCISLFSTWISLNKCLIILCITSAAVFSEEKRLRSLCFIAWNTPGFGNVKLAWLFFVKPHEIKMGVWRYKAVQQVRAKASYITLSLPSTKACLQLKTLPFSPKLEPNLSLITQGKPCRIFLWLQNWIKLD